MKGDAVTKTPLRIEIFFFPYGNRIDLQGCIIFRCIAKSFIYMYIYMYTHTYSALFFSIMDYYRMLNRVPCAMQ